MLSFIATIFAHSWTTNQITPHNKYDLFHFSSIHDYVFKSKKNHRKKKEKKTNNNRGNTYAKTRTNCSRLIHAVKACVCVYEPRIDLLQMCFMTFFFFLFHHSHNNIEFNFSACTKFDIIGKCVRKQKKKTEEKCVTQTERNTFQKFIFDTNIW